MAICTLLTVVCLGGVGGTLCRVWLHAILQQIMPPALRQLMPFFPVEIVSINLVGALLMGMLQGALVRRQGKLALPYALLGTGFLGSFTTFSTFAFDLVALLRQEAWLALAGTLWLHVLGGVAAVWLGYWLMAPRSTGSPLPRLH